MDVAATLIYIDAYVIDVPWP
jgi:hypothetical protein